MIQDDIITASGNAVDISGANSALIQNNQITSTGADAVFGKEVDRAQFPLLEIVIRVQRGRDAA